MEEGTYLVGTNKALLRAMYQEMSKNDDKRPVEPKYIPTRIQGHPTRVVFPTISSEYERGWDERGRAIKSGEVVTRREIKNTIAKLEKRESKIRAQEEKLMIRLPRKEYETKIIKLLSRKELITKQLAELNPKKPKDMKKIAHINFRIKSINEELLDIQELSGIELKNLNKGSRLERFVAWIKSQKERVVKKVKKVWEEWKDVIIGVGSLILTAVTGLFFRNWFRPITA